MATLPVVAKIAALLEDPALERRMAAAIVLGALEAKDPVVVDGLGKLLDGDIAPLQRHALDALAAARAKKAVPKILPLLGAKDDEVRRAAVRAIVAIGEEALPALQQRLAAAQGAERRALEEVLAKVGGKEAFAALLAQLETDDLEAAKAAALAVRSRIKEADGREKNSYLSRVEAFLAKGAKGRSEAAIAGAIKVLGYLEDEKAAPTLLGFALAAKQPDSVRREAIIALRFASGGGKNARIADKLLEIAETSSPSVALTALYTLAAMELPGSVAPRLGKLALESDQERGRLAVERLARMAGGEASAALAGVLLRTKDKSRADLVVEALTSREDAATALAGSLLEARDPDRAWMLAKIMRPHAKKLDKKTKAALVESAVSHLSAGERGWEAQLHVAREADPDATTAALRATAERLLKGKKQDEALSVYRVLGRGDGASLDDQYVLASLELRKTGRDLSAGARERDAGLAGLAALAARGFDVAGALRRDRALAAPDRYYVGFHLVEKRIAAGKEVLADVAEAGGRNKVGKMARAKLASAGLGDE